MDIQDKSKDELIIELQELRQEYNILKTLYDKDNSENKQAVEALQNSERKARAILNQSIHFVGLVSPDGTLLEANRAALELVGVTPHDVYNKPLWESPWWSHSVELQNKLHESIKSAAAGQEVRFETTHLAKDGSLRYVDFSLRPVENEQGDIIYLIPEGHDITERKKAEEFLQTTKNQLLANLENTPNVAIQWYDEHGRIIYWNNASTAIYGWTSEETIGKTLDQLIYTPEAAADFLRIIADIKNTGKTFGPYESSIKKLDGTQGWILATTFMIELSESEKGFVCMEVDITERKLAEEKLSESQTLYHDLVETSQDMIWQCDAQGRYIYLNLAYEKIFGYQLDEMLGRSFTDFQSPLEAKHNLELFGRLLQADGIVNGYESVGLKKDGTELLLVTNAKVVFDAEGHICGTRGTTYDITQRKLAEVELQQSEARLSAILSSMKDIIFEIDLNGRFEGYFAQKNKSLYAQPNLFIGKNFDEILPEDVSVLLCQAIESINSGNPYEQFEYHITVDNTIQWEHAVITPRYDNTNEYIGVTVVCRNITERKQAEANLIKLYTAINSSKASIVITDIKGNIEFANPYFTELTGYSEDEYLGKNPKVLKSGIHSDEFYKLIWDTIKSGHTWEGEFCNRKKNGELYWEKSIITAIKNEKEEIVNFVAVKSDITNEKKHEYLVDITLELYEKCEHLTIEEILKNSIELGIKLTNSEIGFFHFVNDDQETISLQAWSAKTMDMCNVPTLDRHYPISKAGVWVDCFYQKKPVFHNDYSSLSHKKGLPEGHSTLIRDLSVPVIIENKVVAIFGVGNKESDYTKIDAEFLSVFAENVWNIIRRKNAEIDTIQAKEKAQESDKLKSAFLANMSHEIRTPMNGILGFSELLKKPGLDGEKQQEYIRVIEKSGARMLNIINDIVSISKIESGTIETYISETNINEQIENVYHLLKLDAEKKKLNIIFKNGLPDKESIIKTDNGKCIGILYNLVKNAIKFTDFGTIEFGYTLRKISIPDELFNLEFYIKDTGIGIPKDRQEAIFDRFIQADIGDKMARQGAGLGLSISKAYVEMLGGRIWVESEEGIGSTFYFTLPYNALSIEKNVAGQVVQPQDKEKQVDLEVSGLKILIAEDDETSEMLISIEVEKFSKNLLKARTGYETVEVCRNNPDIDLILMDILMPEISGYEATRQIRQFNKNVVIIAQTAFGLSGDREKAIGAGCNDYIAKPIKKDELLSLIQKYFGK